MTQDEEIKKLEEKISFLFSTIMDSFKSNKDNRIVVLKNILNFLNVLLNNIKSKKRS